MSSFIFPDSSLCSFARELAWRPCAKLAEASLFVYSTRFAGCFFGAVSKRQINLWRKGQPLSYKQKDKKSKKA